MIKFPIFLLCANICTDPVWVTVLENLSQGNTLKGINLNDTTISYRDIVFQYYDKPCEQIIKVVEDIYNKANYKSETNNLEVWKENLWKNIKKKKLKDMLIINYVLKKYKNE